jgi:hypothetical protein
MVPRGSCLATTLLTILIRDHQKLLLGVEMHGFVNTDGNLSVCADIGKIILKMI